MPRPTYKTIRPWHRPFLSCTTRARHVLTKGELSLISKRIDWIEKIQAASEEETAEELELEDWIQILECSSANLRRKEFRLIDGGKWAGFPSNPIGRLVAV